MLREVHREPAVVFLQQAHSLAPQHFTQKPPGPPPSKMTWAPHAAHQHIPGILRLRYLLWIFSRRWCIHLRWRTHLQRFVRTHLMVFLTKVVHGALLPPPIGRRRLGHLLFQRAMHPFVSAVLLRMPRFHA